MALRINGPGNNPQVPFSHVQNNAQRPLWAFQPINQNDEGCCCGPLLNIIRAVCERIWECIKEIFRACCPCFDSPEQVDIGELEVNPAREGALSEGVPPRPELVDLRRADVHPVEPALLQKKEVPTTLLGCGEEVSGFALAWDAQRMGQDKLPKITPDTISGGLKKYLAFIALGRFEYSTYPPSYRGYYFAVIRRDVRLLTIELLKLEQAALSCNEVEERQAIWLRMFEALKEIGIAGASGCDPQKSTMTFHQWKQVSQRVDLFETILQHIQDAKLAIFTKRVKGVETVTVKKGSVETVEKRERTNVDSSLWSTHCHNWIYANFGLEFGLCSHERVVTATRDGYIHDGQVTNLVAELLILKESKKLRDIFREEFTREYLVDALLNAINMDEYPKPYTDALQHHCKEIQDDPKVWDKYMQTVLSPRGASFIFTREAVAFFLRQTNEQSESLEIDWENDGRFWNFIRDRIPAGFDGVSEQELNAVDPGHLLRIWNTYFEPKKQ